jgi:hypothetical protein
MSKLQNERARTQAGMADVAGGMQVAPAVRKPLGAMRAAAPTPMGNQLTPSAPPIMSSQPSPLAMGKQVSQGMTTVYGSFRNTSALGGRGALSDRENTKMF